MPSGAFADISSDYSDLFSVFNKHKVKYLVVGAYAVVYYTEPRFTKDLDIWVKTNSKNAEKVYNALQDFGAPLTGLRPSDFLNEKMVYQIGVAPVRVDVMMGMSGVRFDDAWKRRTRSTYAGAPINLISLPDLIRSKRRAGRPQDRLDLEKLVARMKRAQSGKRRK